MKRLMSSLAAAAALAVAGSASAVTLTPNDEVPLPGTTVAAEPQLAGTVLEDWVQPFSYANDDATGIISGTVQSRVVRSSSDGTLDFYWRVVSDASSAGSITALRLGGFLTDVYNANYRIDGLGSNAPDFARLFSGGGGNVNFVFNTASSSIGADESSFFLLLDTDAINYSSNGLYDLSSAVAISQTYATFIPAPVPEPGTYAMLGLGLAVLVARRRFKR